MTDISWYTEQYPNITTGMKKLVATVTPDTAPKCKCGKYASINKAYNNKWNSYCDSEECRRVGNRLSETTYSKLSDYDWLYKQRIDERRSYDDIAAELKCSHAKVKAACTKLKLPTIRYNSSDVIELLKSKEYLETEYNKGKKLSEIAADLKVETCTVSYWFGQHEIPTRNPNSYPRKINKRSKPEIEIQQYIESLGFTTKCSDRSLLGDKEIDILVPDKHIGIEFNGLLYHSYNTAKEHNYHLDKTEAANAKGYSLIHIFEDDWKYRREIVESILAQRLGVTETTVFARKCSILDVSSADAKKFLNENHIQGADRSAVKLGLKYNNTLIAVMTFCKSRYNKNYKWELSRFAVKTKHSVPGAFTRLLTHFRRNNEGSIVSYADRSRSDGAVYSKNGFKLIKKNPPGYWYFKHPEWQRMHRSNFTKDKICKTTEDLKLTEREIMERDGWRRIYDCGTLTFVLD